MTFMSPSEIVNGIFSCYFKRELKRKNYRLLLENEKRLWNKVER